MSRTLLCLLAWLPALALATAPLPREVTINDVEFVLIPAGAFTFTSETDPGHLPDPNQSPFRHARLWLDDYYIAKYEARARDQLRFMNAGILPPEVLDRLRAAQAEHEGFTHAGDPGCTVRRQHDGHYYLSAPGEDLPATELSWEMAEQFAHWMGFRLPSEAEWQKAARGPEDRRLWPWGQDYPDDTHAHFTWTRNCHPVPVDANRKGRSPYGVYNMAGNVAEYVSDWYNHQTDQRLNDGTRNPPPPTTATPVPYKGPQKISKGGRWSQSPIHLAIPARRLIDPSAATPGEGVRFAIDAARVRLLLADGQARPLPDATP